MITDTQDFWESIHLLALRFVCTSQSLAKPKSNLYPIFEYVVESPLVIQMEAH